MLDSRGHYTWINEITNDGLPKAIGILRNFLETDQLQDYRPYPKQAVFHAIGSNKRNRLLSAGNQNGKSLLNQTLIPTPGGFVEIGKLQPGDFVYAVDGTPTRVTGVFPQGRRKTWRVTTTDGAHLDADGDHYWIVRRHTSKKWESITTKGMLEAPPTIRFILPERPAFLGFQMHLIVDPYLLGALIGDGCLSGKYVGISSADEEIIDYCRKMAPEYQTQIVKLPMHHGKIHYDYRFQTTTARINLLAQRLEILGLRYRKGKEKFIPEVYQWAPIQDRLALLQGLMDTDGSTGSYNNCRNKPYMSRSYETTSWQLAQDVLRLIRGLGMSASIRRQHQIYKGRDYYSWRVNIFQGGVSVFRLQRKTEVESSCWKPMRNLLIKSIEPAEEGECTCISIAHESRVFLAGEGFVPTRNTYSCGAEMAMHLTGEYPSWWKGKRFAEPILGWAASKNGAATRDNPQLRLFGPPGQLGTGMIPKRCILPTMSGRDKTTTGLYDFAYVRHITGGLSMIRFRSYEQSREAWQGPKVDVVWFDEEPPLDIYEEGLARTIASKGITMMSFTPLLGYSTVVNMYMRDPEPDVSGRHWTRMTIDDALHLSDEEKATEIARWPKHQRRARIEGLPLMGVGQIFPYSDEEISTQPFKIPEWWHRLGGIDVASNSQNPRAHPTAAVEIAIDPNTDCIYAIREYRKQGTNPAENAMVIKRWGKNLKWAWPKDAMNTEKGTGKQLMELYKEEGLKALSIHAQFENVKDRRKDGSAGNTTSTVSVERGIMEMALRFENEMLKIFSTCPLLLEEVRQYHRDDDMKVVKEMDDLLDALRYAIMMKRFARPDAPERPGGSLELPEPILGF